MARIFITLSVCAIVFLLVTWWIGLTLSDTDVKNVQAYMDWKGIHFLCGLACSLTVVFVDCIAVTYFIGTSRWCKEVCQAYSLDEAFVLRSNRLKRRTFPLALSSMLLMVGIIALGAASDPSTGQPNTGDWAMPHLIAASIGMIWISWSFLARWNFIRENFKVVSEMMDQVKRIRRERGLDDDAPSP